MGTTRRTPPQDTETAARAAADTAGHLGRPGDSGRAQERAHAAAARLAREGALGVALTWVDNAGLTRVKAVPAARLPQALATGVGMSPCFDVYLVDDSMTTSAHIGGPGGDLRLVPDLERLTVLAAQPGWAWAPADRYEQDGTPYAACQRGFARRMAERALREHGIEVRMGFETEWVVTSGSAPDRDSGIPAPFPASGPAYGMARLVGASDYLRDVLSALTGQGVEVLQIHPEYAPGQFEVSVAPSDPVGAADLAVLVRETVRAVSLRHGLTALFGPVVDPDGVGSGAHVHLSLWREGRNLCAGGTGPFGMTPECEAFLAGVLRQLPALLALGAPSPAGYLRLRPSRWAGAFQCWGPENREAALRFIAGTARHPQGANAEVKCVDAAANPYLLVGGVIAAGLAGLADGDAARLVDTGLPGPLLTPGELAEAAGAEAHEIVRLERLAERAADTARDTHGFLAEVSDGIRAAVRTARGFKSVAAYRCGLGLAPSPPGTAEIYAAADRWLASRVPGGRLTDPVLERHLLWSAVRTGLPLQIHTGFGDPDLRLDHCDPLLLTDFIRATAPYAAPLILLHCYPYHRGAGYLAAVFPHVYADFGLSLCHTGARARAVLAELMELTPFGKLLFSTDAYALPELYLVGARLFREAVTELTREWVERGEWSPSDAGRVTAMIAGGTARRLYGL